MEDRANFAEVAGDLTALENFRKLGQKLLDAHVLFDVLPDANRDRKAFLVKVRFDAPPEGLRSGMSAEANIVLGEKPNVVLAPAGTPADVGVPKVARPEPALTSSASAWPW